MFYRFLKRLLDISVSSLGLLILAPLMLVLAFLILFRMGRPVIFKQRRSGCRGKPFVLYKFRTMLREDEKPAGSTNDESRITPLGRKLRRTGLDELPQLWNVLKGNMSLVGPRPLLLEYLPLYSEEQQRRHDVKPGMTGWAQMKERRDTTWRERLSLDVWYVENRSLWLDLKILATTIFKMIKREGVFQEGRENRDKFDGKN